MKAVVASALTALLIQGCALLESHSFTESYSLDPLEFKHVLDLSLPHQLPIQTCDPLFADGCAAASVDQPGYLAISCDARTRACIGVVELRRLQIVDLSSQSGFPSDAVKYGVSGVGIDRIPYWITTNTFNVALPAVDLFVAPQTAPDESAPKAVRLGQMAMLQARSASCGDSRDTHGDDAAGNAMVCDLPLTDAGRSALASFAKDFKTPFALLVHGKMTVRGGEPIPSGMLDLFVRPRLSIGISK